MAVIVSMMIKLFLSSTLSESVRGITVSNAISLVTKIDRKAVERINFKYRPSPPKKEEAIL